MTRKHLLAKQARTSQRLLTAFNSLGSAGHRHASAYAVLLLHALGTAKWADYADQASNDLARTIDTVHGMGGDSCSKARHLLEDVRRDLTRIPAVI